MPCLLGIGEPTSYLVDFDHLTDFSKMLIRTPTGQLQEGALMMLCLADPARKF
jgi:hypothetical protein